MSNSIITDKLRESRHNTNIGGINITSLNIGRKRPIFCREVKPGDKGTLSISGNYILNPLVATNVGKVHVKTEAYFIPACDNMVGFEDMLLGKPVYKNGVAVNPHVPRVNAYNWVNQFFLNCNYNTSLRCYSPTDWDEETFIIPPTSLVNVDVQEQLNALGTRDFDKNSSTYFKNDSYCSVNPTNEIIGYIPFNLATRLMRGEVSYEDVLTKYAFDFYVPFWTFHDDDTQNLHFCNLHALNELNVPYSTVYDFVTLHMSGRHGEEFMLLDEFQQKSHMMTTQENRLDSFFVPIVRLTQYGKDVFNLTNAFKWIQTYNPMYLFNSTDTIHMPLVTGYNSGSFEPQTRDSVSASTSCLFSDVFGNALRVALNDSSSRTWMLNNLCKRSDLYAQGFDYFFDESVPSAIANICVNNTSVYFLDINAFVDNICSSSPLNNSNITPISDVKLLFNLPDVEYRRYSDLYVYNFEGLCGKLLFDFTYLVSLLPLAAHCSLFYTHTLPKVWKNLFYRLYSMLSHDGTYDDATYFHLLQVLLPLSFVTRYDDNFLSEVWATPTSPDGEVVSDRLVSSNGVLQFSQDSNGINPDMPAYGVNNSIPTENNKFREQLAQSVGEFLGVNFGSSSSFDIDPITNNPKAVGDGYGSFVVNAGNQRPESYSSLLALKLARHLRSFALKNNVNSFSKIAALCERFGMKYETHDLFESSLIYSNETEIEVQKIASTTETNQISLGDIAGHGESYDNGKKVSFRADRFGYVIVYLSVTPVGVLYEGRNKEMSHINMLDFYSPQTDALTMTPVSSSEVRARYDDTYLPVKLGSSVFGFAPYGYEYKIGNNVLSGDFLIRSAGKYTQDSYHLLRTLGAGASFNGNGTFSPTANNPFNYSYLVQNPFFNLSFDAQQFNRIFQSTDSLLDKIYFFGRVDFNLSRQGRPLFDLSLDENATESIN